MQPNKSEEERMDDAIVKMVRAIRRFRDAHQKWKNPIPAHILCGERDLVDAVLRYTGAANG